MKRWWQGKRQDTAAPADKPQDRKPPEFGGFKAPSVQLPFVKTVEDPRVLQREAAERIAERRQAEFKEIGIPYKAVQMAEAKGVKGINPNNLTRETAAINDQLKSFGFRFSINALEMFECQLIYIDYQKLRLTAQKAKQPPLPEHSLIEIVVLREAERLIRMKHGFTNNPVSGPEAKRFQIESAELLKKLWSHSRLYQLKVQAVNRLKRERQATGNEPILEADVIRMVEKIQAESAQLSKK